MNVLEGEGLFVKFPLPGSSLPLPRGGIGEVLVIAQGLALRRLTLYAEVAAARFGALQRVHAHQLAQFEEVRDSARLLERLV